MVLVESRHICIFYELGEAQYIFKRINFIYLQSTIYFFITFYQIRDALNLSKTISGAHRTRVCCGIEYSFLKINLYGFVQNFNRTVFVRFDVKSDDCAEKRV